MKRRGLILTSVVLVILLATGVSVVFAAPHAQDEGREGFGVITSPGRQLHPQLTYNPTRQEYMIVWGNGDDIFAQRLSEQGRTVSSIITITQARGRQDWPAVAYDPGRDRYLVMWDDDRNAAFTGHDLFGRFFSPTGGPDSSEFPVITAPANQRQPRLAFREDREEFLVIWSDSRNAIATGLDIFGQLLRPSGSKKGGSFSVSTAPADQRDPAVAFNSASQEFLVMWRDNRDPESFNLFGQRIKPPNRIGAESDALVDNESNQFAPSLSFDIEEGEFLVIWCDNRNGPESALDLIGQQIDLAGNPRAGAFSFVSTSGDQASSGLAYDPDMERHLAVWGDNRNLPTTSWDIFGVLWPFN
ncbi:MAG: hypothetical protein MAG451_00235 [Anaerolineales bacterium]|nr:hypothetical protein [Anaerolineales bacterium]